MVNHLNKFLFIPGQSVTKRNHTFNNGFSFGNNCILMFRYTIFIWQGGISVHDATQISISCTSACVVSSSTFNSPKFPASGTSASTTRPLIRDAEAWSSIWKEVLTTKGHNELIEIVTPAYSYHRIVSDITGAMGRRFHRHRGCPIYLADWAGL